MPFGEYITKKAENNDSTGENNAKCWKAEPNQKAYTEWGDELYMYVCGTAMGYGSEDPEV